MSITARQLTQFYHQTHNLMRNIDGLHPQEAFDELLKYLFFKIQNEKKGPELEERNILLSNGNFGPDKRIIDNIRKLFATYLKEVNSWSREIWHDCKFHLSDKSLFAIHETFKTLLFTKISIDIKSAALRSFLAPEMRKGLGIFLTPEDVVKAMIQFLDPSDNEKILDPACGSGTFLIESLRYVLTGEKRRKKFKLWGIDKNPKMLLLADLNLGHEENCTFNKCLGDFLIDKSGIGWKKPNTFDVILTNPPFGVILENKHYNLDVFAACRGTKRQQSEIVFLEQCLKYLKPGGKLGIVLPKSVITNETFARAREAINNLGYVTSIIFLPSETFQIAGTQTTTIVLFMKKFTLNEDPTEKISIGYAQVTNVGYDTTGRTKKGNQLITLADELKKACSTQKAKGQCKTLPAISKEKSLAQLKELIIKKTSDKKTVQLGDVVHHVGIGQTPPRNKYAPEGLFILKVGNLTGNGINWTPRERNFIERAEKQKRERASKPLMLKPYDIVLTSSAHTPFYIAEKVDIITTISEKIGKEATFVGELMLVRPNKELIAPLILMAYLRTPRAKQDIQNMIRGQTAHLYPKDLMNLAIPKTLLTPDKKLQELAHLIKEEITINERKNKCVFAQNKIYGELLPV